MCGINGFNFGDEDLIDLMNNKIRYRGPDDKGHYSDNKVSIGNVRLAILDLTKAGSQPYHYTKNGMNLIMVYNGEIFNFMDIKQELEDKGHKFDSNSDTEVILAAYDEWGEDCVKRFNGMWGFCIYDKKQNKLFLSRDRFGKKPLYYHLNNKKFIFSSELKTLLEHDIDKRLNKDSIREIFTYRFTFDEKTIFEEIYNFRPGYYMVFDLKTSKIEKYKSYYDINKVPEKELSLSFEDAKKQTYDIIHSAVKYRMVASDVPVATLLSGGIDSSIITYFASKYNKKLNTFSIGFETTNELNYAKEVSKHFKTKHNEIVIKKEQVYDHLYDMVYHMDEPIGGDPGFFPVYILSKEVSKKNKVVLSGDGADEVFVGYDRYKMFYYGRVLSSIVPGFLNFDNEIFRRLKGMKNKDNFQAFFEITKLFDERDLLKMGLKPRILKKVWNDIRANGLRQAQVFDIKTLLPKDFFMKADKMSSAFGLEQRVPFMDHRVVEFGLSLPNKYKLKGWNEKYILKETFKDKLPEIILKRRKHGFNVPIDYWFENDLGDKLLELLDKNDHNLYKKNHVKQLLENLRSSSSGFKSKNIIAQKLWSIIVFEIWYDIFIVNKK
mgnify:CR=1 FL=1